MRVALFSGLLIVILSLLGGCANRSAEEPPGNVTAVKASGTSKKEASDVGAVLEGKPAPESISVRKTPSGAKAPPAAAEPGPVGPALKSREADHADALVAKAKTADAWKAKTTKPEPQAGRLTAGSFDDNLFPEAFRRFAGKLGQDAGMSELTGKLFGRRLVVTARGKDGRPLGNARVRISSSDNRNGVDLISRSDGRVVFVSSWDNVHGDLLVTVTPPDGSAPVTQVVDNETSRVDVSLPAAAAALPNHLDLVFVIDTTGSMGDELTYLSAEFKTIATTVAQKFPNVQQRYGLVVYRDRGDQYVAKHYPFTTSVDEFRRHLSSQIATGGGDYPEAMEVGLDEAATKLSWSTDNTARVLFLVADAPPHTKDIGAALSAADALRKKGVAIYPLACSGYDPACELVMRSCALLTGGQFLFLTDDSGVGEAHGEPHIPFYHVERQGRLMVRMVASELSGQRLEPAPEDIIRTVGNPPPLRGQ